MTVHFFVVDCLINAYCSAKRALLSVRLSGAATSAAF